MHGWGRRGRWLAALVLVGATVVTGVGAADAAVPTGRGAGASGVNFTAVINDRPIDTITASRPLRLESGREATIRLTVTNRGDGEAVVRSVRLYGRVMGLMFYVYDTRVDLRVPSGGAADREFSVDMAELGKQATGLLVSRLSLLDERREVLASRAFPVDVRGSLLSVYGVFGLAVAGTTILLLVGALLRLASHRLSPNRWSRGVRFGVPGLGAGLTLTFTLSALRFLAPDPSTWVPFVLVGGLVGFVIGYLTPSLDDEEEPDLVEELETVDADAGARTTWRATLRSTLQPPDRDRRA